MLKFSPQIYSLLSTLASDSPGIRSVMVSPPGGGSLTYQNALSAYNDVVGLSTTPNFNGQVDPTNITNAQLVAIDTADRALQAARLMYPVLAAEQQRLMGVLRQNLEPELQAEAANLTSALADPNSNVGYGTELKIMPRVYRNEYTPVSDSGSEIAQAVDRRRANAQNTNLYSQQQVINRNRDAMYPNPLDIDKKEFIPLA